MTTPRKLWHILTAKQRRTAVGLLGLMMGGMVLETLSVGLVIPVLAVLGQSDQALAANYPVLAHWVEILGNPSHERLVVIAMLTLVGLFAFKTLFLAFLVWLQGHFVYGLQAELSERLFAGYLRQPYTFHLLRNSAELLRNIIGQVGTVTNVLQQGLMLITETLVLTGISALLVTLEPVGALLVVTTVGLAGWAFHRMTRSYMARWGQARLVHEGLRIQHLQQGLGGAKDAKLLGREADFLNQYHVHNAGSEKVSRREFTLGALPRLWLEMLAICALAVLVIGMIGQGKPQDALLPALGLFAAAAFRLMPSANRVINALQCVRFSRPVIDMLSSELRLLDDTNPQPRGGPLPFTMSLALDRIQFAYPSAETQALRGVSLTISRGSSVGFIGGSGAGKSTLVDIMLGLLTPDSGAVKVDGIDIRTNLRGWQDQIGYVPQSIFLTDDTLRRNVAFGLPSDQINEAGVWRAICAAQLTQFVEDLPKGLETLVGERGVRLSGGQRQRIGIARALYHDPSVLVLDEATSSLDTGTERSFMEAVRALQGDKTVIIVAHRPSTVEHCNRLFRVENGRIVDEGQTAAVMGKDPPAPRASASYR